MPFVLLLFSSGSFDGLSAYLPGLPAGYQRSSPPPRMTSTSVFSRYCRATSSCWRRSVTCAANGAAVASVTCAVHQTEGLARVLGPLADRAYRLAVHVHGDRAVEGLHAGGQRCSGRRRVGDDLLRIPGSGLHARPVRHVIHLKLTVEPLVPELPGCPVRCAHAVPDEEDHVLRPGMSVSGGGCSAGPADEAQGHAADAEVIPTAKGKRYRCMRVRWVMATSGESGLVTSELPARDGSPVSAC